MSLLFSNSHLMGAIFKCVASFTDFAYVQGSLPQTESTCVDISNMNLLVHFIEYF